MVTLFNLLDPKRKGLIPKDILCIPRKPDHGDMAFRGAGKKNPTLANQIVTDVLREDLKVPLDVPITLVDFLKKSKMAKAYEWRLGRNGALIHFPFGLFEMVNPEKGHSPFTTLVLLRLDITEWLKTLPEQTLRELCLRTFERRRNNFVSPKADAIDLAGTDEFVLDRFDVTTFFESIARPLPDDWKL